MRGDFFSDPSKKPIETMISALADEEIISCEVMGYNSNKRVLHLKWIMEFDPDSLSEVSISNLIDNDAIKKLKSLSARID